MKNDKKDNSLILILAVIIILLFFGGFNMMGFGRMNYGMMYGFYGGYETIIGFLFDALIIISLVLLIILLFKKINK